MANPHVADPYVADPPVADPGVDNAASPKLSFHLHPHGYSPLAIPLDLRRIMASNLFVSPLLHPVAVYLFQTITAASILGFTSCSSPVRLAAVPLQVACVAVLIQTSLPRTGRIVWASYFAGSGITCLLHYVETALLSRWTFESKYRTLCSPDVSTASGGSGGNTRLTASRDTVWDRLRFSFRAIFSSRHIGTSDEVKNVPPFSAKDSKYAPSRRRFLLEKAAIFLVCYMILDLATSEPPQPGVNATNFSARKVPFFGRLSAVSTPDLVIRLATTIGLWVSLYCVIQAGYSVYAFVCVALNIDEPKSWRPAFGSLEEAYSIRRFWGMFWHQFQRQKLTGSADFLVFDLVRLQRGSLTARYAHLLAVFAISGLQHALVDRAEGYSWQSSGSIQFFLTQAAGIMLEDAIQAMYNQQLGRNHNKHSRSIQANWVRYTGYIWVAVFLIWSTPVWIYPALRVNEGEEKDILLPFSIIGFLKA
ncbi:hypothetical protein MMC27_001633 [Xylographa pallens]|nr:hypothetical protein [Xylographa pallens]